jgi:hypothetical protein
MKRACTTCQARGLRKEAKFVASDVNDLLWFECDEHEAHDNIAEVERVSLEPIGEFFTRAGIPIDALDELEEQPPPTERNPRPVLEHD